MTTTMRVPSNVAAFTRLDMDGDGIGGEGDDSSVASDTAP